MSVRSLHTAHYLCETFIQAEHISWLFRWVQLQLSHCFLVCWVWYWVRHSNRSYDTAISNKKSTVCKLAVSSSHKPFSKFSSSSRNSCSLSKLSGYRLRSGRISWQTPGAGAWLQIKSSVSVPFQQKEDSFSLTAWIPEKYRPTEVTAAKTTSYPVSSTKMVMYVSGILPCVETWKLYNTFKNSSGRFKAR